MNIFYLSIKLNIYMFLFDFKINNGKVIQKNKFSYMDGLFSNILLYDKNSFEIL